MDTNKVLRVVGLSSAVLFDRDNPYNPINRRISIIVMNEKAENAVTHENDEVKIDNPIGINKDLINLPRIPRSAE